MKFQSKKFLISDPIFLSYFLPRKLKKESIFPFVVSSFKKNSIELEVSNFSVKDLYKSAIFLSCLENRFLAYQETSLFDRQEFSLCFQSLDFSNKTLSFTKRRRKVVGQISFLNSLKEKESLLQFSGDNLFLKSRLLKLTKGGFVSSCFGSPAFIIKSSLFYKFRKQISYRNWFSLNIPFYGVLSFFSLVNFEKKSKVFSKKSQKRFLSKRFKFYYFKNEIINYFFLLGTPKKIQLKGF